MPEQQPDQEIVIDGEAFDTNQLTFGEQLEVRRLVRDELIGDPTVGLETMTLAEFLPALVFVVKRRTDPEYTLEQALALKTSDVLRDASAAPADD